MSCSFLLIPSKFPTWNSYSEHMNSSALLGFSSFSCLRNRRRSNSIATFISRGRSPGCKCQLADIAPITSAAYGVILLGGGLFAFSKSGSKGSLFGGLTGVALMGTGHLIDFTDNKQYATPMSTLKHTTISNTEPTKPSLHAKPTIAKCIEYLFGVAETLLMGLCMLNMERNRDLLKDDVAVA
ncbi:hypothetical protein NC653_004487 [Populus alba x Populus x berolinensis]|uniref:Uncharacterized protein n=1 Tax=Populus alba x Populus x berolinensis TaxID=444605 RepID=A0AAD6RWR7_9ROSI|nr:hypothetical protein NC653_004487 [Populus alba x Populus x berolinensis]